MFEDFDCQNVWIDGRAKWFDGSQVMLTLLALLFFPLACLLGYYGCFVLSLVFSSSRIFSVDSVQAILKLMISNDIV